METTPVRIWKGLHEAIQIYAKNLEMDASTLASMQLMKSLFTEEDLPEEAKTLLARDFFQMLGEGISEKRDELARWAIGEFGGKRLK